MHARAFPKDEKDRLAMSALRWASSFCSTLHNTHVHYVLRVCMYVDRYDNTGKILDHFLQTGRLHPTASSSNSTCLASSASKISSDPTMHSVSFSSLSPHEARSAEMQRQADLFPGTGLVRHRSSSRALWVLSLTPACGLLSNFSNTPSPLVSLPPAAN